MKDVSISKVSTLSDGRLAVFPSVVSDNYEFVYREACGVYWNKPLACFQSTVPKEWGHNEWYGQIISVARSAFRIRLHLVSETLFESDTQGFKGDIQSSEINIQQWILEQEKIALESPKPDHSHEKSEISRISEKASVAFHAKKYQLAIDLLSPHKSSKYFSKKCAKLLVHILVEREH